LRIEVFVYLEARLFRVVGGNKQQNAAIEWVATTRLREGDGEVQGGRWFGFHFSSRCEKKRREN
jgi:hypothetical protein